MGRRFTVIIEAWGHDTPYLAVRYRHSQRGEVASLVQDVSTQQHRRVSAEGHGRAVQLNCSKLGNKCNWERWGSHHCIGTAWLGKDDEPMVHCCGQAASLKEPDNAFV